MSMSSNSSSASSSSLRLSKIDVMPSESAFEERDRPDFSRWSQDGLLAADSA